MSYMTQSWVFKSAVLTFHLRTSIADNPIVYASDGFVSVTGYSRSDIIPRNCRFLQGNHTDHAAVRRLKTCIGAHKESVELLLNYRKTGEPFWNLLYVSEYSTLLPTINVTQINKVSDSSFTRFRGQNSFLSWRTDQLFHHNSQLL